MVQVLYGCQSPSRGTGISTDFSGLPHAGASVCQSPYRGSGISTVRLLLKASSSLCVNPLTGEPAFLR